MISYKYIRESFSHVYQCIFKPLTFGEYTNSLNTKSRVKVVLELSFFSFVISVIIVGIIGIIITIFGHSFDWIESLILIALSIAIGILVGIAGGIAGGIAVGIAVGIAGGIVFGIAAGNTVGNTAGIAAGIAFGIVIGIVYSTMFFIRNGIVFGIVIGIVIGIAFGIAVGIESSIAFGIAYFFSYFRVFYIFPHMIQYLRVKILKGEPFCLFRHSPIYWDETILMPLPFLSDFLVILTQDNMKKGLFEIEFVSSKRPTQRKAALIALLEITVKDLSKLESIKEIADVSNSLDFISAFESYLPKEFSSVMRYIENISNDAKSYVHSTSNYNKVINLNILMNDIDAFKKKLVVTKGPVGYKFSSAGENWYQIITEENKKLRELKKQIFEEIPNPYIFGNPVRPDDTHRLFVGRMDIIKEIKVNLYNISQKPALFLHGRRRVGKSSILINLPRFLGNQYVSAYIDCQDARTRQSNASFCYSLAKSISSSLIDRGFSVTCPSLDSFKKSSFTILGNWFDELERKDFLAKEKKIILIALDEYEKIEESIIKGALTIEVLDQLRNIIQHREHFAVLITGTKELKELTLDWSDYLISAKTIKIGHLTKDEAKILITNPIDDFNLNYEGGESGKVINRIIDVTNCHPYLVQALCFELVNYLNYQQRKIAKFEDIDVVIEKLLISAESYFYYIWNSECSKREKQLLIELVNNRPLKVYENEIYSLIRKEIIEKINGNYRFKVELMKKWIRLNCSN
jgi:hypothetical protein